MFGLFSENGPFSVAADAKTLVPRALAWTKHFNLIYIDNPLGVGFSYTETADGFVTNEQQVGLDLFLFLEQFFTIFDNIAANPLIIAGESYGGKYAPSAACYLHSQIVSGRSSLKLSGVSIGDGAINPAVQFTGFADLLFYLSMADRNEQAVIRAYEHNITAAIAAGDWKTAFGVFDALLNGDFFPYPTYFRNISFVVLPC
jgi:vitellogenic carboxypeptidase-like protein